jgi:hypothetical protein
LVLILPVVTASVERAFSAMNFFKHKLRNKMGDGLLDYCLVTFIERDVFFKVDEEDIMNTFVQGRNHPLGGVDRPAQLRPASPHPPWASRYPKSDQAQVHRRNQPITEIATHRIPIGDRFIFILSLLVHAASPQSRHRPVRAAAACLP